MQYFKKIESLEGEKKRIIKNHTGFINVSNENDKKKIETTEEFKIWKTSIIDEYNQKIAALRESLEEKYQEEKNKKQANYPIFMAIAEDIGYDATGRATNSNELDIIDPELTNFIDAIEQGKI
jgi:type I restriction enzyme M protein